MKRLENNIRHWHTARASRETFDITTSVLITLFSTLFFLLETRNSTGQPVSSLLLSLSRSSYFPNTNFFNTATVRGLNAYILSFYLLATSVLCIILFRVLIALLRRKRCLLINAQIVFSTTLTVFVLLTLVQTRQLNAYFLHERRSLQGQSPAAYLSKQFTIIFDFAEYCKKTIPSPLSGNTILRLTDTPNNFDDDATFGIYMTLRYFLFPLDISLNPLRKIDFLIIISLERDPMLLIPAGFELYRHFSKQCIIVIPKRNTFKMP